MGRLVWDVDSLTTDRGFSRRRFATIQSNHLSGCSDLQVLRYDIFGNKLLLSTILCRFSPFNFHESCEQGVLLRMSMTGSAT